MDFVTAKSQQATKHATDMATGMLTSTRATLDEFAQEFAKNPDKSRALLNLLFVPHFKPSFVDDAPPDLGDPDDAVELLGPAAAKPLRYPVRMFDLDTGNLVEYPDIGALGQYCILSHSWKGNEVDLGFIHRARAQGGGEGTAREDDVTLITRLAKADVESQVEKIKALARDVVGEIGLSGDDEHLITKLLVKRRNVTWLLDEFNSARKEEDKAKSKLKLREMDANAFKDLAEDIEEQVSRDMGKAGGETTKSSRPASPACQSPHHQPTASNDATTRASTALDAASADVTFFQKHIRLREAVDAMVWCLQRSKSSHKIAQSIAQARRIFSAKGFATGQQRARYLWNDTCCINKANPAELVESLSIMGDWYAHAEFCLVHLDTRRLPRYCRAHKSKRCTAPGCDMFLGRERSADEWIDEWAVFNGAPREANLGSFDEVREYYPEWAERGWTLQELVLSKTTFYVNSAWEPLERPVDSLGPYYYIVPFLEGYLYTDEGQSRKDAAALRGFWSSETLSKVLSAGSMELEAVPEITSERAGNSGDEVDRVRRAIQLVQILVRLGVPLPRDIDSDTAISFVTKAVHLATTNLSSEHAHDHHNNNSKAVLAALTPHLGPHAPSPSLSPADLTLHTIHLLLRSLVAEAKPLIVADRRYIGRFSHVARLSGWEQGLSRARFPAETVLALARRRRCTVKTDAAYSLMGLAGVRFPPHAAEGLPRAVSRLLDEVVVAFNDVSVCNWAGIRYGSPIRGRSLYPASLKAYSARGLVPDVKGDGDDDDDDKNKELADQVQIRMHEVMAAYQNVFRMLREAIDFIKRREQKHLPVEWVQGVVDFVQKAQYASLRTEMHNVGKILAFIQKHCGAPEPVAPATEGKVVEAKGSGYGLPSMPTMPTMPSMPSGFRPSFTAPSFSKGMSMPKLPSKGLMGMGMKTSFSTGFGKKDSSSSAKEPDSPAPLSPPPTTVETPTEITTPSTPKDGPPKVAWEPLHPQVMDYIAHITPRSGTDSDDEDDDATPAPSPSVPSPLSPPSRAPTLPQEVASVLADIDALSPTNPNSSSSQGPAPSDLAAVISPHPIIVNSSGISGVFDIQRVVVTFRDVDKLRARVRRAAAPHQRIAGWCTVSTGFAVILTKFACEKAQLERQLDVARVVADKVVRLRENGQGKGSTGDDATGGGMWMKTSSASTTTTTTSKDQAEAEDEKDTSDPSDPFSSPSTTQHTASEARTARIIAFIQEPSLSAVAGEWVLARFSGAPGAKWFLCALELGASPGTFYGRRIASDALDFTTAAPEPGLLAAWQTYMTRKKRKLCKVLKMYIDGKAMGGSGAEAIAQARRVLESATGGGNAAASGDSEAGTGLGTERGDGESVLEQVLGRGRTAAKLLGQYTVLAVLERALEMRADRLDRTLGASVLKRTPKALQAAVESLNDNRDLSPAMFHSSQRVHMF